MEQWYKIYVHRAHTGHHSDTTPAYIFVEDAFGAYERFKKMKGIKYKHSKKSHHYRLPDIIPVSEKEAASLEKKIVEEGRISLSEAKRTWYYPEPI